MARRVRFPLLSVILLLTVLVAAQVTGFLPGGLAAQAPQTSSADVYQAAIEDWQAGRYHAALPRLVALLRSPAADAYRERIALLTGEWYPSVEITPDGRAPKLSGDGRFVSWETGPAASPTTRIVRAAAGAPLVAEISGAGAEINANGTHVAWIRLPQGAARTEAPSTPIAAAWLLAQAGDLMVRELASGTETVMNTAGLLKAAPRWAANGRDVLFVGATEVDPTRSDIYRIRAGGAPEQLTNAPGFKTLTAVDPNGDALLYVTGGAPTFRRPPTPGAPPAQGGRGGGGRGGGGRAGGPGGTTASFAVLNLTTGAARTIAGTGATMSADGRTIAWVSRSADGYTLHTSPALVDTPTIVRTDPERLESPALSPDGSAVAYQWMEFTDWELYVSRGTAHERVTRDIQHDLLPRFLTNTTLLGMMGEGRHRRSQVYDLTTGTRRRLLHNNTIRTVVPEYSWQASADGQLILTVADHDGDTVSPERGVYLSDLRRTVTTADLLARLTAQLAHETELRTRTTAMFAPIADNVRQILAPASVTRVFAHAKALFDFDSKHISRPGNAKAIAYLTEAYRAFGYEPQQQWFDRTNALGGRTANVLATLRGTVDPDLVYVISSHFDSVAVGPGADDDTSGTTALLEAARLLAKTPMPATIIFASLTGEEAGLLGSREFVRQAAADNVRIVGALNNDMIGWAGEGPQLNNTIRYSNAGIRDIQHGAAFLFTDLVLFDTKYYRGTDAAAFYESWGDIVGGIGSYPILANPNYHQPTDYLDTINQRQVTETAKVTAATIMYLASSPSRLNNLTAARAADGVSLTWDASPETGVRSYLVAYGPAEDPLRTRVTVTGPSTTLPAVPAGTHVAVKAVNDRGLEGWDWARTVIR
jgi:Tol biopolymer transport system component